MRFFVFLLIAIASLACTRTNKTVYEWRGPERTGIYLESNLLQSWPEEGPDLIWETNELGTGYGSPLVVKDRILVMGTRDSLAVLFAFNLDGHIIYETEVGQEWVVNFPGSRCTPTVVGDLVYVMTGKGQVSCVHIENGKIAWTRDVFADYDGVMPRFGYAQSLVVDSNMVFCCPGGEIYNVVALNSQNGELIWTCAGKGERPGYNPAKLIKVGERKLFLTFSAYHLLGIEAETGQLLWSHEQLNTTLENRKPGIGDTHGNTVLFSNNIIYYVEGDGNCAVALQLSDDGLSIHQLWNNAVIDNFMGGIIMHDNFIYSCSFSANQLVKIDCKNGAVVESLPLGRGSVIMADNMLYYYSQSGEVHLVNIHGEKMQTVSSFKVENGSHEHFAHPVIQNGVLYIRHGEYLGAYSVSNKS